MTATDVASNEITQTVTLNINNVDESNLSISSDTTTTATVADGEE